MKRRSEGLRRAELVLWLMGLALLGVALAATAERWTYQAEQERALSDATLMDRSAAGDPLPRRVPPPEPSAEMFGPVPAPNSVPRVTTRKETLVDLPQKPAAAEKKPVKIAEAPKKRSEAPIDPFAIGRIEIPRLGVRAIIRRGADDETLDRAVGLLPGAASPGEAGNVVLAAHRDTFFRPLKKIRPADRIRLVVPPNEYVYEVESTRVVTPQETSVLQSHGLEELTLVTCYPFGFLGPAPDRFIVSAKRVQ